MQESRPEDTLASQEAAEAHRRSSAAAAAAVQAELASHMAWRLTAPHGLRVAGEDLDAALRRNRLEVLRTVAAMRANEDEFGGAKPARIPLTRTHEAHLPPCGPAKALYPRRTTAQYKTMADLAASAAERRSSRAARRSSVAAVMEAAPADATVRVGGDPRAAVAEKHRAAVETVRPQVPAHVERSLRAHKRFLGSVKPYGLSHNTVRADRQPVLHPLLGNHERYVDRMQCCRPSKGLFVYYE